MKASSCRFPEDLKAPFAFAGKRGQALLIHGFTGIPNEVRPLAEVFGGLGFSVIAPLLPGHGLDGAAINEKITITGPWPLKRPTIS